MMRFNIRLLGALLVLMAQLAGCAKVDSVRVADDMVALQQRSEDGLVPNSLHEKPAPKGGGRIHEFTHCAHNLSVTTKVEKILGVCSELFRYGSGSDGIIELEMALDEGIDHPLIFFTLGQLYLLAGQGNPDLMPSEGPAEDVGNWERNKKRLLGRAETLLTEAGRHFSTDGAVDFLLADVARSRGDFSTADELAFRAADKCLGGRTFQIMRLYQELTVKPAEMLGGNGPIYPEGSLIKGISGPVVLDLLLSPRGEVRQAVVIDSPAPDLSRAAADGLFQSYFQPGKIGKYPVWSWLQVTTNFNIEG